MPNTVPAAAEGMPKISRRKALAATGTALAAALTTMAVSVGSTPAHPAPMTEADKERLWLAKADPVNRAWFYTRKACDAARENNPGSWFFSVRSDFILIQRNGGDNGTAKLVALLNAHRRTFKVLDEACSASDEMAIGRKPTKAEKQRLARADGLEAAALTELCAYVPDNAAERFLKAEYLFDFGKRNEFTDENYKAILLAMATASTPAEGA